MSEGMMTVEEERTLFRNNLRAASSFLVAICEAAEVDMETTMITIEIDGKKAAERSISQCVEMWDKITGRTVTAKEPK